MTHDAITPAQLREEAKKLDSLSISTETLQPSGVVIVMQAERAMRSAASLIERLIARTAQGEQEDGDGLEAKRQAFEQERCEENRDALRKLSRELGHPAVMSTVSLADGLVEYALTKIRTQAARIKELEEYEWIYKDLCNDP